MYVTFHLVKKDMRYDTSLGCVRFFKICSGLLLALVINFLNDKNKYMYCIGRFGMNKWLISIGCMYVTGLDDARVKKKPWRSEMQRDIMLNKDLADATIQGGKAFGKVTKRIIQGKKK